MQKQQDIRYRYYLSFTNKALSLYLSLEGYILNIYIIFIYINKNNQIHQHINQYSANLALQNMRKNIQLKCYSKFC